MSQIILVRLGKSSWSYGQDLAQNTHCRLDPSSNQHGALVDEQGVLHYFHINVVSRCTSELLSFQLQLRPSDKSPFEPIRQTWAFEFVPGLPGEIMLVQPSSCRILYASLPRQGTDASDVFLFGSHSAPIKCIKTNGNSALSGCSKGTLHLWRMADGQLADSTVDPAAAAVTAVEYLGPLMVAAGTAAGAVTLYDIASGRLLAVQRLAAGPTPVSCLAAWLNLELLQAANLAAPGPSAPDGGGVLPRGLGVGLAGRDAASTDFKQPPPGALLAVASSAGWLKVYQASQPGSLYSWQLLHSSRSSSAITAVAFSSTGDALAVAGPSVAVIGTDASAIVAAGGQPGTVSLYSIDTTGSSSSNWQLPGAAAAAMPNVSQQQQQGQAQLQLWQQWCVRSVPVHLAVLPGSGVELRAGRQLDAVQVLHLLVTPVSGSSLVLTSSRPLQCSSSSSQSHQQRLAVANRLQETAQLQGVAHAASATNGLQEGLQESALLQGVAHASAAADGLQDGSQETAQLEKLLESLVAKGTAALEDEVMGGYAATAAAAHEIAETGNLAKLAEVAGGYAAAAVVEAAAEADDLAKLESAAAGMNLGDGNETEQMQQPQQCTAAAATVRRQGHVPGSSTAADEACEVDRLSSAAAGQAQSLTEGVPASPMEASAAAAAAGPGEVTAAAAGGAVKHGFEVHAEEQQQVAGEPSLWGSANLVGASAAAAAEQGGVHAEQQRQVPGEGEALAWCRRPATLPTVRSWMDKAAAVAAGTAAPAPTGVALVQALQEEWQQQQQQAGVAAASAAAAAAAAAALDLVDGANRQIACDVQQQQHGAAAGEASDDEIDFELPCESTFQELQQQQYLAAAGGAPIPAAAAALNSLDAAARAADAEISGAEALTSNKQHNQPAKGATPALLTPMSHERLADSPAAAAAAAAAGSAAAAAGSAAAAAAGGDEDDDELQPRQLPTALQQKAQHCTAAGRPQQQQQPGQRYVPVSRVVEAAPPRESWCSASRKAETMGVQNIGSTQPIREACSVSCVPAALPGDAAAAGAGHQQQQLAGEVGATAHAAAAAALVQGNMQMQQQQQQQRFEEEQKQQQDVGESCRPQQQDQVLWEQQRDLPPQQQQHAQARLGVRERLNLRKAQQHVKSKSDQIERAAADRIAAAAAAGGQSSAAAAAAVQLPVSDHPLASAVVNSTRLLERKMQEAEQLPEVSLNPDDATVIHLAVKLADLDVDFDQQLYQDLPDLKDLPTPRHAQKLVPKQLDARWVAKQSLKPQMDTLFRPEEWQPGAAHPQLLLLPSRPTPQQVVQQLLWPRFEA